MHEVIADKLGALPPRTVVDLGCGTGPTLAALAARWPTTHLVGLDHQAATIDVAARNLEGRNPDLRVADLEEPLDLPDSSIDAVVCHNVLECVSNPVALVDEVARILEPGGRAVWSHTDFDTVVINTADVELSRRVIHAYADLTQPWMAHSDGRMGRKLVGIVRRSHLALTDLDTHVLTTAERSLLAADRIDNICAALALDPMLGRDVLRWRNEIDDSVTAGDFVFAETTFIVTTTAP